MFNVVCFSSQILVHKMTASLNDAERIKKSMAELEVDFLPTLLFFCV